MNMSVNQMLLMSKIFLTLMALLLLAAIVIYFVFDISKAWRILTNKSIPLKNTKTKKHCLTLRQRIKACSYRKGKNINTDSSCKGQAVTTVLRDIRDTVLLDNYAANVKNDKNNILLDISFINTEIIL